MPEFQFSLFSNLWDSNPKTIRLSDFEEMIAGGEWNKEVSAVRSLSGDARKTAKESLPAVSVSGVFSGGHKASDLAQHSGLICMDFDATGNPELAGGVESMRDRLSNDQYSLLAFVSAGGEGLAVICEINPDHHKESFEWLSDYFQKKHQLKADRSCTDVSRLRFVSWDSCAQLTEAKQSCYVEVCSKTLPTLQPLQPLRTLHNERLLRLNNARDYLKEFEERDDHSLYEKILRKFTAKAGERNQILTKQLIPFLYGAVAEKVAMEWVQAFYWYNAGIFNDPIEQHMKEARAAWNSCETNYRRYLTPTEREYYNYIADVGTPEQLTLFRICRDLSLVDSSELKIGVFALSAEQCRLRLGLDYDMQGQRLLMDRLYKQYGVVELVAQGKKRTKGVKGVSNIWRWTIGETEEAA